LAVIAKLGCHPSYGDTTAALDDLVNLPADVREQRDDESTQVV
jgi:hypothetical protein